MNDINNRANVLKELFSLSKEDVYVKLAAPLFTNDDDDVPILCKTKFLQSIITVEEKDNEKVISKSTLHAYENAIDIKNSLIQSKVLDFITDNDEQRHGVFSTFNNDHLYYGISNKEGVFISNIEIILTYVKFKSLTTVVHDPFVGLLDEEIIHLKNAYQQQYLIYNPVFLENKEEYTVEQRSVLVYGNHNLYQNAVASLNQLFDQYPGSDSSVADNVYMCTVMLNAAVFNNPKYWGSKTQWLKNQVTYLSWLVSKFEHYSYLQVFEGSHEGSFVNPATEDIKKAFPTTKSIKIVKWYINDFIKFHATKISADKIGVFTDISKLFDRTLGKILLLSHEMDIQSVDSPRYEEFINTVYSLLDERLSLNQKYHN